MRECLLRCASHLQLGKLLRLVAGVFCVDELREEELVELKALRKVNTETWTKVYYARMKQ